MHYVESEGNLKKPEQVSSGQPEAINEREAGYY
jgi:hypothetical protein